jgi:hypothetical protein
MGRGVFVLPFVAVAGLVHLALVLVGIGAVIRHRRGPSGGLAVTQLPAWWGKAFRWAVVAGLLPLVAIALLCLDRMR